jgi:hypothetical protein
MKLWTSALLVVAVAGILALFYLARRWWVRGKSGRLAANLSQPGGAGTGGRKPLMPENLWLVCVSDTEVRCTRPGGIVESVGWDDLRRVEIVTTDEGPFAPDVFWVLHGTTTGCVVPQGADGEDQLLQRLQALPGFRNEEVIKAMSSAEIARFLCWERGTECTA